MGNKYKWEVLALLWIAFLLNQADRQVFNVVLPLIRDDLQLSDTQVGFIATIFNLVFALLVPLAGYIGDLYSKKWLVVFSVFVFSLGTIFTGLSNGMLMLIVMRSIATGAGESFYAPPNYALIGSYHKSTRALAMSIHQTAYYIGVVLSGLIAGYIGDHWGWRYAFYIFGILGLFHGLVLIFRLKDKKDDQEIRNEEKIRLLDGFKILFRTPTALMLTIAFSGLVFTLTGYLTWMPTYLFERFHMSHSMAGFHSMFYTHLFAFIGIIISGKYSDKVAKKNPSARLLMQGFGLLLAVPFILVIAYSNILFIVYIGFAGFGLARAFFDANTYTILYDVIPVKFRSSVSGVVIFSGFAIGSLAPIILGYLKTVISLSFGIAILSVVLGISSLFLFAAYKYYFKNDSNKLLGHDKIMN